VFIKCLCVCVGHQSGSTSDTDATVHNARLVMTSSSPHLAMFGYQRTVSAPAGAGGSQPALVGVDPSQPPGLPSHLSSPGFDVRPHTISSAYERYHARSAVSAATFDPPPALRAPPPQAVIHRSSPGPPPHIHTHQPPGPAAGLTRSQRPQRDEVIYQSVLRTPGSPHQLRQLQQQAVNNGICDTTPGMYTVFQKTDSDAATVVGVVGVQTPQKFRFGCPTSPKFWSTL